MQHLREDARRALLLAEGNVHDEAQFHRAVELLYRDARWHRDREDATPDERLDAVLRVAGDVLHLERATGWRAAPLCEG